MIDARELRVGNLLRDKISGELLEVDYVSNQSFGAKVIDRSKYPLAQGWQAEPIPLTEQWLLDLGFEYDDCMEYWYNHESEFTIEESYSGFYLDKVIGSPAFEYVHQFQNIYFALTGTELTRKLI